MFNSSTLEISYNPRLRNGEMYKKKLLINCVPPCRQAIVCSRPAVGVKSRHKGNADRARGVCYRPRRGERERRRENGGGRRRRPSHHEPLRTTAPKVAVVDYTDLWNESMFVDSTSSHLTRASFRCNITLFMAYFEMRCQRGSTRTSLLS